MNETITRFWESYLASLPPGTARPAAFQAWAFGDSPALADELGALVLAGLKTATAGLVWAFEHDNEPLPRPGDYSIILNGQGEPLCIIQTTRVDIVPFNAIEAEQAYLEGEGDRTLDYFRNAHEQFFKRECARIGREFAWDMPVVCERFRLVSNPCIINYPR